MVGEVSTVTRTEVLGAIRNRYLEAAKGDKSRMLDEFVALTGCHRKHAVRLLNQRGQQKPERIVPRGKRIYDEAVRQALVVVWETLGQDLRQETEGSASPHGRVAGETRSPRPRPRRARAAVLGKRLHHRPPAETGEGEGRQPQETQEEEEDGQSGPGTHLHGLERSDTRVPGDRPGGP